MMNGYLLFLVLSSCLLPHHHHVAGYTQFQALGFGVNTGPVHALFNDPNCAFSVEDCPGDTIQEEHNQEKYCTSCLVTNDQCRCDPSTIKKNDDTSDLDLSSLSCTHAVGKSIHDNDVDAQCYIGKEEIQEDVLAQIQLMKDAVEKAYEEADPDSNILKIFNAPEFYWRGPEGA